MSVVLSMLASKINLSRVSTLSPRARLLPAQLRMRERAATSKDNKPTASARLMLLASKMTMSS